MCNDEETTISIPTYVSLCSGYDGIGIGLKRAIPGLRTIAHVEIETYAIANLISKMEAGLLDACPVFTDLKQFPYRELRDRVTILSAGFPCQPFSSAGKRRATEDERHLYPYIADGITAMRPRYVLLENVEGIISAKTADGESVLKYVLGDLEERGYRCTWGVFSASETGAPHQRKRVFILGKLSDTNLTGLEREASERVQGRERRGEHDEVCESTRSGGQDGEELGDAKHDGSPTAKDGGSTRSEQEEGRLQEPTGRCEQSDYELANCENERCRRRSDQDGDDREGFSEQTREKRSILRSETERCGGDSRTELGDATSFGSCRGCEDSDRIKSEMLGAGLGKTRWPSRPGQQQYEWEQPRVVANGKCERLERQRDDEAKKHRQDERIQSRSKDGGNKHTGQAQSCVGLSANGTAFRVDELRLLGNGVVPDCCELAWQTLSNRLHQQI